ncbi:MAG: APHP domain-containing protein [Puniceicoccaceae bacterium 5H]|nr:MAG: APHP domain-containing protein [Puniceicoccaceae bacterium 5H]
MFTLFASAQAQTPILQVNAGGGAATPYAADADFSGGNAFSSSASIDLSGVSNPAPQAVYQSVRWAPSFSYMLNSLSPGTNYRVRLHFVELSFSSAGQRTFNVAINGSAVLSNFDIVASAGVNHALVREFTATANASGEIEVAFSQGGADNPSIAGIEVLPISTASQSPYGGSNRTIAAGSQIEAEDYDLGGEGVAYHDSDAGNNGGAYRSDDVDVESTSDNGGGYNVGWMSPGEWLEYTTDVTGGTYNIVLRAASGNSGSKSVRLLLDGTIVAQASIPNTGGWQSWQDVAISNVSLPGGNDQILRLEIIGDGVNLNRIRFEGQGTQVPAVPANLSAAAGNGQVSLSWASSTGASSYDLYRSTASNNQGSTPYQSGLSGTSYTDNAVSNGTTYYYKVAAVNAVGSSALSAEASATPGNISEENLALGAAITGQTDNALYPAENAVDGDLTTYWESQGLPGTLTVDLGLSSNVNHVTLKLNPDAAWSSRQQTIAVSVLHPGASSFTQVSAAQAYTFTPPSNSVTIPVGETATAVRVQITQNTGAPGGQIAEFQVMGTPGPNPDLTITSLNWTPSAPTESNNIVLSATVENVGTAAAAASSLAFSLDSQEVETAQVSSLAAGGSTTVSATIPAQTAGSYTVSAQVDTADVVNELDEGNNLVSSSSPLTVSQTPGPDLEVVDVAYTPEFPADGASVSFTVQVRNRGTTPVAAGTTTRVAIGGTTLQQTNTPTIGAGQTVSVSIPGSWTAAGSANATATADATGMVSETNENNNTATVSILSGRGAAMPYTRYDSEDASIGGGAAMRSAPNFDYAKIASEASNQSYIALPSSGAYAQWTVVQGGGGRGVNMRFTMPDSSDGMGLDGSLDCYVNGSYVDTIDLSSYWSWQYFAIGSDHPVDAPNGGQATFRFDEVHWKLPVALQPGDTIRIQSSGANGLEYGVDFLEIEPVPAALSAPANAVSVTSYGAVANDGVDDLSAFNQAVAEAAATGRPLYIPAGTFHLDNMWVIGSTGSPISQITIQGAGIWHTNIQFTNSNAASGGISFRLTENGQLDFGHLYLNSSLRSRYNQNAVYKCFMDNFGANSRVHNFWEEHFECGFWVADYAHSPAWAATGLVIEDGRIRNNLADGVNFCQGTSNSTVRNCSVRNNGDDGLAVWTDSTNNAPMGVNNTFSHNTIENNWRAAGIAFFGGSGHQAQFNYIKDCFMGSGIRMNTVFPGYHFENNTGILFSDTTIENCGTSHDVYNGERGAIDLEASNTGIQNVTFRNIDIFGTQRDAIQAGYGGGFTNILFEDILIDGTGLDDTTTSRFAAAHDGAAIYSYTNNGTLTFDGLTMQNIENDPEILVLQGFQVIVNP